MSFGSGRIGERQSALVRRDDEGAPPHSRVDLDGGRAVIGLPVTGSGT
ncbi:DUF6191 domain-containing protein [Streptomyces sp. NPDC054956]